MKLLIDFSNQSDKRKLFEILKSRKLKTYVIEIKEAKEKRTLNQNSYYWVCLGIVGKHCGYTSDEMHELMKFKFLGVQEMSIKHTGEVLKSLKSTSKLNTLEFTAYIENIRNWSLNELDCYLPTPEEYFRQQIELNVQYLNNDY